MNPKTTRWAAAGASAAAAVVARQAVEYGWTRVRGEDPPSVAEGPDDDTQLRDLLLWFAVLTGAVMVARRLASSTTQKVLGDG